MKRDMELIRKLLFAIEAQEFSSRLENPPIEGYDEQTIDSPTNHHHSYTGGDVLANVLSAADQRPL